METKRWINPYAVAHDVELVHELDEEGELNQNAVVCMKNPGHKEFIPMNEFSLHHLPEKCRNDGMLDYVRAIGDLTLRMTVSHTSTSRPDTFPDREEGFKLAYYQPGGPYPFKKKAGSASRRMGSGYVLLVNKGGEWQKEEELAHFKQELSGPCLCSKICDAKSWARFQIVTARHLVYDQEEADHLEIEFFFNKDQDQIEGRTRKLQGGRVLFTSLEGDRCNLHFYTHDMSLIERLEAAVSFISWDFTSKVKLKQNESGEKGGYPAFVLGHPHGCSKVVTIGEVTEHRMDTDTDEIFDPVTTFNAPTCPGSSGGPVVWFRYDNEDEEVRLISTPRPHCGSLKTCCAAGKRLGRCGQLFL